MRLSKSFNGVFMDKSKLLTYSLTVSGVLLIISLFTFNSLFMIFCLTLFTITVVANCCDLFVNKHIIELVTDVTWNRSIENFKNKKYISSLAYVLMVPLMCIGIICVIIGISTMWIYALTFQ